MQTKESYPCGGGGRIVRNLAFIFASTAFKEHQRLLKHDWKEKKRIYLHARTRSALWLGPTYLYAESASHTTFKKVSLATTRVVNLLYSSNGIERIAPAPTSIDRWNSSSPLSGSCDFSKPPELDNVFPREHNPAKLSLLIISNTLRLICHEKWLVESQKWNWGIWLTKRKRLWSDSKNNENNNKLPKKISVNKWKINETSPSLLVQSHQ